MSAGVTRDVPLQEVSSPLPLSTPLTWPRRGQSGAVALGGSVDEGELGALDNVMTGGGDGLGVSHGGGGGQSSSSGTSVDGGLQNCSVVEAGISRCIDKETEILESHSRNRNVGTQESWFTTGVPIPPPPILPAFSSEMVAGSVLFPEMPTCFGHEYGVDLTAYGFGIVQWTDYLRCHLGVVPTMRRERLLCRWSFCLDLSSQGGPKLNWDCDHRGPEDAFGLVLQPVIYRLY
ncbi:unnamed protein product [Amoebophrya sp. A25]|nr:unnamed protein product [Amoebophrya sp. A25]|eukprot:GSA25T00027800001.1